MTIKGTFKNGVVVPEGDLKIADGTPVELLVRTNLPLSEAIKHLSGTIKGPKDFARNHDHYIHGTPKK